MSRENVNLNVEGMSCSHCINSIKKSVGSLEGVSNVGVDLKGKKVNVTFDPAKIDIDLIKDAIEEQGYDVIQ